MIDGIQLESPVLWPAETGPDNIFSLVAVTTLRNSITLGEIENGLVDPKISTLTHVANALGVT
ncbi:MAG: hypothetical protein B7Y39_06825 [Bdellovibrio sp. 28-41-41]|nr:MAG: hypothetical protein B7Y39_06825 [Bdellovibrio sp. 28-41-41]